MGKRLIVGLAAFGVASALATGTAAADPPADETETIELECDNGETYTVVVAPGNGSFTPAFDTDSTATLIPVAFGEFSGEVRDADGNVIEEFDEPGESKGQSAKGLKNPVTCSFTFTEVSDGSDPEFPEGFSFTGSGTVVVRITPGR